MGKRDFKDFLLYEYSNIAQAHFKSIETISTFFRYYLLIMSIPISAITILFSWGTPEKDKQKLMVIVQEYQWPISIVLICISLIGLGIFCYIINLRLDAILYARVVNGIRKYFYDDSDMNINLKLRMRALPQSPQLPLYYEKSYFLPVVFAFGILNTLYSSFAYFVFFKHYMLYELWWLTFVTCFLSMHYLIYAWYSHHRETAYLKSNIIGIDIDGVLNKHREQFCQLLSENCGKTINPANIIIIPVHEEPGDVIERNEETKVFNDPRYWINVPAMDDASQSIRRLKNIFKLKVFIFTYRPWPDSDSAGELIEKMRLFVQQSKVTSLRKLGTTFIKGLTLRLTVLSTVSLTTIFIPKSLSRLSVRFIKAYLLKLLLSLRFLHKAYFVEKIFKPFKEEPLKQITEDWLGKHSILYDKLIFEKGNDYSTDPRGEFTNRFYIARKMKIKFFVEDDVEKAIKLSHICDVIFLMSQPYNQPNEKIETELPHINQLRKILPSNVIRVASWDQIYQHLRSLL